MPENSDDKENEYTSAVLQGKRHKENEEYEKALESFDRALGLDKPKEAIFPIDESIRTNPANMMAWYYKGQVLVDLQNYDRAIPCFDKSIELGIHDDHVYFNKGYCLFALDRPEESIYNFNRALEIEQKEPILWNFLGEALMLVNKEIEAIAAFEVPVDSTFTTVALIRSESSILLVLFQARAPKLVGLQHQEQSCDSKIHLTFIDGALHSAFTLLF